MKTEDRPYDPPKPKKDRSGFVIRTAALALMSAAAALIVVYMMNAPSGSLTPASEQVSELRAPPQFRSFEDTVDEAADEVIEQAAPTPAATPAPRSAAPAPVDMAEETPVAPAPLPLPETPAPLDTFGANSNMQGYGGGEDGAR